MNAKPFAKRLVSGTALLIEAAALCVCSTSTMAAVIVVDTNIVVPQTNAGIYINVVTGVTNVAPASAPGWDLNLFGSTGLNFFNPTAPPGGVYVVSGTTPAVLNPGDLISAASAFGSGAGFRSTQDAYLGFRLQNETMGNATNYGYARLTTTGPSGHPAVVWCYAYEDTGAPITVATCGDLLFRNGFQ